MKHTLTVIVIFLVLYLICYAWLGLDVIDLME
jgi:hypothetical protein